MHRHSLVSALLAPALLASLSVAGTAQETYAPKPLPGEASSHTQEKHNVQRARSYSGAFVEDYLQHGKTDPKWNDEVERVLELYGEGWGRARLGDRDLIDRILRAGRRAVALDCEDPLVLLAIGDAALMGTQIDVAEELLPRAWAELRERSPSPWIRYCASLRVVALHHYRGREEKERAAQEQSDGYLAEAIADKCFSGRNERYYVERVMHRFDDLTSPEAHEFIQGTLPSIEGVPRWPLLLLQGRQAVADAWAARGRGFADSVTEDGWKGYREHLVTAGDLLMEAHELRPQFPEAAEEMISVGIGLGMDDASLRAWFDASVAAQFDYMPAYRTYLWYLMPRWGGSHRKVRALGEECLETARFDTDVPRMYRVALEYTSMDLDNKKRVWDRLSHRKKLRAVHEGYLGSHTKWSDRALEASEAIVIAALAGRAEKAAELYQSLDTDFSSVALQRYRVDEEWLMAKIEPHFEEHVLPRISVVDVFSMGSEPKPPLEAMLPIEAPASAPTTADWEASRRRWAGAAAVESFRRHGERSPDGGGPAEELLGKIGQSMWDSPQAEELAEELAQMLQVVSDLVDGGCDDPLVLFMAGCLFDASSDPGRSLELVNSALSGLEGSSYPAVWTYFAKRRLAKLLGAQGDTEEADTVGAAAMRHGLEAVKDPMFRGENGRFLLAELFPPFSTGWYAGPFSSAEVDALASDEDASSWLRDMIVGLHHGSLAANAPFEAWPRAKAKEYMEHVRTAEVHLRRAFDARPDHPESAAAMIVVRMLEPGVGTRREWFDRAIRAEVDFEAAYQNYAWSLRPGRSGSLVELLGFAEQCLATERFETMIPQWFVRTLGFANDRAGNPRWIWSSPKIAESYERLAAGTIAAQPDHWVAKHMEHGRFMTAWAAGDYARAAEGWEAQAELFDTVWLTRLGVDGRAVKKDLVHAAAGK